MNKLVFLIILASCFQSKAQVSVVVEQPELHILYRNYNNIIIPEATGAEENKLSAEGVSIQLTTYQGKKGYIVKPSQGTRIVPIVHDAKINGEWIRFDTVFYKVKSFPKPQIYNRTISKSSGAIIQCGFPLDSPIRCDFEVLSIVINDEQINGFIISGDVVKNNKLGYYVAAIAKVKSFTGLEYEIPFSLKVTN